jgi:hypothetical protein
MVGTDAWSESGCLCVRAQMGTWAQSTSHSVARRGAWALSESVGARWRYGEMADGPGRIRSQVGLFNWASSLNPFLLFQRFFQILQTWKIQNLAFLLHQNSPNLAC